MTGRFWIKTLWVVQHDEEPWMAASYDWTTFEAWGEEPEWYTDALKRHAADECREVKIEIDYDLITDRFRTATISGRASESDDQVTS